MKTEHCLTNCLFLPTGMGFGLILMWITSHLLRYAYPFRLLFDETCIYIPDDEVGSVVAVFLFGLGLAIACFLTLYRRSPLVKRFTFRVLASLITFSFGVFITTR